MSDVIITSPAEYYPNPTKDKPLFNGQMYIGVPDIDAEDIPANQKQVKALQENGSTVNISQPIAISPGGVPVDGNGDVYLRLLVDGNYSQVILDNLGGQQYYMPNAFLGQPLTPDSSEIIFRIEFTTDILTDTRSPAVYESDYYDSDKEQGSGLKAIATGNIGSSGTIDWSNLLIYNANGDEYKVDIGSLVRAEIFGLKKDGTDASTALNDALSTQLSVEVGPGRVSLANPVQIKYDGQALFGHGTYNTSLEWIGTDNTKNMIELWSGRRDLADDSLAVTNQRLENFKIETKTGSVINNLIWVEAGCFHGWIQKIRGFDIRGGVPQEAIIKYDSNGGQSYPLGMNMRDVVVTGGLNDDLVAVPIGIWLEGAIEGFFESVKVYTTEIGWQIGTPTVANIRTVADCTFVHCHSEIGDRGFATGSGRAMLFYQGRNLSFYSLKAMAGADFTVSTNQLPLRFTGADNFQNKNINFTDCTIWGQSKCQNAMNFDSNVNYQGVRFKGCEFFGYESALMTLTGDDVPLLEFDEFNTFVDCEATPSDFKIDSTFISTFTVNNASGATTNLQAGNDTTQMKREEAILVGHSSDTVGIMASAYKATPSVVQVRSYNRSGGSVVVPDGYFYTRGVGYFNSRISGALLYNPPSIAAAGSDTTTVSVFGAKLGDIVAVSFDQDQQDVNLFGYVSAEDVVTVYFVNRASSARDLDQGIIKCYILGSIINLSGMTTYDPPSLAASAGVTTTVSVPGANLGDIATFSFSLDLQGVVGYAWVSAADTVSIRFQNESGGVVDLASGTLRAGVVETPRSI